MDSLWCTSSCCCCYRYCPNPPPHPPQPQQEQQEEAQFEEDSVFGQQEDEEEEGDSRNRLLVEMELLVCKSRKIMGNMTTTGGKVLLTVLLGLTGIMFPSLSSLPYLLCFQVLCTWWAWSGQVPPLLFRCVSVMSLLYSSSHFLLFYCYQLPSLQEAWPPNCTSASVFGLVSLASGDCAAPWRLHVNSDLSWFHFGSPLMLLLLYHTVASLWRNQMINGDRGWVVERTQSAVSGSCDMTATSHLSDDVSSDITAERRRELWRRAHDQHCCSNVLKSSTNDSPSESFAPPTQTTALGLDRYCMPHYSLSQSDTLETCIFEGDGDGWEEEELQEEEEQLVCLLTFWLLLRQTLTEKRDSKKDRQLSTITVLIEEEQREEQELQKEKKEEVLHEEVLLLGGGVQVETLVAVVTRMFVKYWIYVCGTMFFFVSFEGKIVLYKVIYMVMFLCCVALYQLNYERWRALLRGFWVAVVVYSMLVLILVYTFQFPSSLHTWSYYTGLSKHRLEDLGLEKFSLPVLFTRIFILAAFLLVCIVHLHYFHEPFLQLTDLQTVVDTHNSTITRLVHSEGSLADLSVGGAPQLLLEEEKREEQRQKEEETEEKWRKEDEEEEEYTCMFDRETLSDPITVLGSWRLVVDRLSVLFLRLLLSLQRLQRLLWWLLELHIVKIVSSYIIWVSVKEVCVFNLLFVACVGVALPCRAWRRLLSGVCTVWTCVVIVCKMLYQLNVVQPISYSTNCTMYNLMMLALLAFEVTIYRHQELYRLRCNKVPPPTRTLFHDITRCHLDDNMLSCTKYFLNYFFYKFGLETCFLLAVNVIGQRMDLFAVGHAFGLITVLSQRSRKCIASAWPKYCYFLSGLLCFQYLLCIGLPPSTCTDYPWRPPSSNMDSNVVKWLFLPDHLTPPNPLFLLYDFLLLLGASLQLQVFDDELQPDVQQLAGDNSELQEDDGQLCDPITRFRLNTVPDFLLCRSYLDMMKVIIFSYMFWFVLTIIFITGTTRISIFCMGYLVACFYFLLVGGDLLLKPVKSILVYWDCLIGYNVFVITMKNILSILACGFIKSLVLNHCWLIQLFSLACTIKGYTKPEQQSSKQCELPSDEAGIIWDGVCFGFLLLQRRVFRSHYFLGAELFEASTVKAVRARLQMEKTSMDLLKRQMERIKTRQQKFRRGKEKLLSLTKDSFHTDGEENIKGQQKEVEWWRPWVNHASMVRSGDYYLFETDSEEEEEEKKEEEGEKEEELPEKSALQFVYHAWITDSRTAMRARSNQKKLWKKNSSEQRSRREEKRGATGVIEMMESEEDGEEQDGVEGPDTVLRRFSSMLRFCWVLLSALLDSLTAWLRGLCQEHIDISTVLRIEHCMLTQQAKQGKVPSREAIHIYYQEQMLKTSRDLGLDYSTHDTEGQTSAEGGGVKEEEEEEEGRSSETHREEEEGSCLETHKEKAGGPTPEEEPEPVSGGHPGSTEPGSAEGDLGQTVLGPISGAAGPDDTASGVKPASGPVGGDPGPTELGPVEIKAYPECPVDKTSRRRRPRLSRMQWVESLSSSSEDLSFSQTLSLVLGLDLQEDKAGSGFRRQVERSHFLSESTASTCPLASRTQELTASELLRNRTFYNEELEASDSFYGNQPQLLQLCYTLYNILAARSETVCYLVIVLNHMVSASCLTLVLPVLVFLWATLSVPRPSKTFWMTAIIYTEVTIVIKYFFQFGFFPFNQKLEVDRSKPFHPPNILGVEKKEGYVLYDLLQLLVLFYHRAILKCHGLWDQTVTTETNTPGHNDNQADSAHSSTSIETANAANTLQQRGRRHTHSSSIQLRSPAGSMTSRAQQLGRLDLLIQKLQQLSIRAKKCSVSRCMSLYRPVYHFFRALVQPEYSAVTDVYVLMFLADTVDFIIIVFGFWAFGKHSAAADITSSLSEDQVPEAFLVMVLIQFGMSTCLSTYLCTCLFVHLSNCNVSVCRRFNQNLVAQLWYFVKCVYFGLSANQIRSGYPTRVLGNFLTKSYNYLNLFLFQGFRLVPFLTELRAVMDWVWTDTTLSLSSWICVEDVYAHSFRYPQPRGQKKKRVVKYGMGGLIVLLLICIVWFPLLFMSLIKSVAGVVNRPLDVSLTITLGGFQPIFTMSAQQNQLKDLTEKDFSSFISSYSYTPSALQFLEAYSREDVTLAELQGSSNSLWTISPPSRTYLSQVLSLDHFPLTLSWTIQRNLSLGAKAELASGKHVTYLDDQTRLELIQLLNGTRTLPVVIQEVLPCFIRAPSDSNAKPIEQLYPDDRYKDILLALERSTNQSREIQEWWIVDQPAASLVSVGSGAWARDRREAGLQLFVFSDKVSPPSLGFLAGYGIMGLYASVVLVIGKFVREFFSGISHSIMFEELPCVDRILKLCTDIFLVRETGELELEEELYAKLIFLYRSPETLIKWTRR
ncbi:hypothetical protein PAMP_010824 [Pampus punctatissimus]